MHDLNDDDDRLRALPRPRPLAGLGRLAADEPYSLDYLEPTRYELVQEGGGGGGYTMPAPGPPAPVEEYYPSVAETVPGTVALPTTASVPANAVPVVQTMTASTGGASTLDLPKFNFETGVASCNTCASDGTTASAVAANATGAKVTPLPEAPKQTNWLLWAVGLGVAFYCFKGPGSGLGCPDDAPVPAPAPATPLSGAPPRRPEPKKLKKVESLKIS